MYSLGPPVLAEEPKQEQDSQTEPETLGDKPSIEMSFENNQSPVIGDGEKETVACRMAKTEQEPMESNENHQLQNPQAEPSPPIRASVVPFNTPDYRFECICGELGLVDYKARVQCMNCMLWQHAECVNYKEENLATTPFYCPHCLVAMTPVPTRATLIISPSSICHQWVEEINRHIRSASLRVLASTATFTDDPYNSHRLFNATQALLKKIMSWALLFKLFEIPWLAIQELVIHFIFMPVFQSNTGFYHCYQDYHVWFTSALNGTYSVAYWLCKEQQRGRHKIPIATNNHFVF